LGVRVPPDVQTFPGLYLHSSGTEQNRLKDKIINFFTDIIKEMKKVTWPKREELKESTMVVIVTSLIFAVFVYIVDKLLNEGLKIIF
jgi:preprotein translocase subunit SecE